MFQWTVSSSTLRFMKIPGCTQAGTVSGFNANSVVKAEIWQNSIEKPFPVGDAEFHLINKQLDVWKLALEHLIVFASVVWHFFLLILPGVLHQRVPSEKGGVSYMRLSVTCVEPQPIASWTIDQSTFVMSLWILTWALNGWIAFQPALKELTMYETPFVVCWSQSAGLAISVLWHRTAKNLSSLKEAQNKWHQMANIAHHMEGIQDTATTVCTTVWNEEITRWLLCTNFPSQQLIHAQENQEL